MHDPLIVALTPRGRDVGLKLAQGLGRGEVVQPDGGVPDTLHDAFRAGRPLVCVMALGIVVRVLGPLATDKRAEPPVLAVDEAGRFVIPVLGGHAAGANDLATEAARALGAVAVITTASDALGLPAVDLIGRDWGWKSESPAPLTEVAAAVVRGERVGVWQDAGRRDWWTPFGAWPASFVALDAWPPEGNWAGVLVISDRILLPSEAGPAVVYRPPTLVLGIGCRRGTPRAEIEELFAEVCRTDGLAPQSVGVVATAALKADEPGLIEFAAARGLLLQAFTLDELARVGPLPTPSEAVRARIGIAGVAEPAALLAAGVGDLVVRKRRGRRVTLAVAQERGMTVYFIGAGPGDPDLLTLRGRRLLERCPVCLYAGSLVPAEVVGCAPPGATVVDTAALNLDQIIALIADAAAAGRDVARVHSGDPCLYGATAEQMRRLDALGIAYEVVPGVSSFAAAAAALKLELTPAGLNQTVILTRAPGRTGVPENESLAELARHRTGLVLFLGAAQVPAVVEALAPHYGPDAPVVVAYRVSWPDEQILRCTLATLARTMDDAKIRLTALILVGPMLEPDRARDSRLYDPAYSHRFRRGEK